MRALVRTSGLALLAACATTLAASAAATGPNVRELPESYALRGLPSPAPRGLGTLTRLRSGVTYQASRLSLAVRVRPPDGTWAGAQWKSARLGWKGGGPPFFGWVALGKAGTSAGIDVSRGSIVLMTAYARTPSVAATVAALRTRGHGAAYEATSPAKLAGFSGIQFDGRLTAAQHVFIPFSPRSRAAKSYPDAYVVGGSAFRVMVLNVRGKTLVVFIDSAALPAEQFPAFLTTAEGLLGSLRFPS